MEREIREFVKQSQDKEAAITEIKKILDDLSDQKKNPVNNVIWVNIDKVQANNYNPNSVPVKELELLFTSIDKDGFTQPVVTIWDDELKKYVIIDGFHRYYVTRTFKKVSEMTNGKLPIVVLKKDINDRMASTVRHNRARGEHSVEGMSRLVFKMLENGWKDKDICNELGMEAEELLRLKHITGFSKLFEDAEYQKAWTTRFQIKYKKEYDENSKKENRIH